MGLQGLACFLITLMILIPHLFSIVKGDGIAIGLLAFGVSILIQIPISIIYRNLVIGTPYHPNTVIDLRNEYLGQFGFEGPIGFNRYEKDGSDWCLNYPKFDLENHKIICDIEVYNRDIHDCDP